MGLFRRFTTAALALALLAGCGLSARAPAPPALPTADLAELIARSTAARAIALTPQPTSPPAARSPLSTSATPLSSGTASPSISAQPTLTIPTATIPLVDLPAWLESQLIDQINQVRVANGLPAYHASAELSAAARAHSCDLATHHSISHSSSDGRALADRLAGATPPWEWPSESIAAGTPDAATVVAWWMDEPPAGWHRRNILDQQQRDLGAGYCFSADDPTGNHHYWTADFSRRAAQ